MNSMINQTWRSYVPYKKTQLFVCFFPWQIIWKVCKVNTSIWRLQCRYLKSQVIIPFFLKNKIWSWVFFFFWSIRTGSLRGNPNLVMSLNIIRITFFWTFFFVQLFFLDIESRFFLLLDDDGIDPETRRAWRVFGPRVWQ